MFSIFLDVRPTEPIPDGGGAAAAEAILRASYRIVFSTLREHRRLARLLFEEAVGLDKGFSEALSTHYRAWHGRVRGTLDGFRENGSARGDLDSEMTAEMVLGTVERLARRHLFAERAPDLDRIIDAVVALEMRGIGR